MELTIYDVVHIIALCTEAIRNLICIYIATQKKDGPPAEDRQPADRPQ